MKLRILLTALFAAGLFAWLFWVNWGHELCYTVNDSFEEEFSDRGRVIITVGLALGVGLACAVVHLLAEMLVRRCSQAKSELEKQ
jgi:hypothetical protein